VEGVTACRIRRTARRGASSFCKQIVATHGKATRSQGHSPCPVTLTCCLATFLRPPPPLQVHCIQRSSLFLQTKFTPIDGQDRSQPLPYDPKASLAEQVGGSQGWGLAGGQGWGIVDGRAGVLWGSGT
jgi:hypothetical protein